MNNLPVPEMLLMNDIVREGDPILRQRVESVPLPPSEGDRRWMELMLDYLKNSQHQEKATEYGLRAGVGLSANQIGLNKRMCAIYIQSGEATAVCELYNPKIISHSAAMIYLESGEGCLSVDRYVPGYVPRYAKIKVKAADAQGKEQIYTFKGYTAIVVQHELDHLDGVMFYDRIAKDNPYALPQDVFIEPI
ncbi:peptide deformylase [Paenibacillus sp. P96]|uniref:Peptide deformylase n=1 Tax=Paenibacillus zeirhizosphaerae TaxID=2987519 RepID=A0ABT9FTF9_9BACL|nr:peptide deformylase [Paenibacillus sp. P96]MDP4098027.1 peptide deformylase [Paenibacillus sp. P96]